MNSATPHPDRARYPRRGMLILSGIMFLMYCFSRLVALVYIRQPCDIGVWQSEGSEPSREEAPTL
jgi:hypothetical protein